MCGVERARNRREAGAKSVLSGTVIGKKKKGNQRPKAQGDTQAGIEKLAGIARDSGKLRDLPCHRQNLSGVSGKLELILGGNRLSGRRRA